MQRKWLPGLLALFVALFLLFRSMKNRVVSTNKTKTQRNNNPFALIQPRPDRWQGLVPGSSGFLTFEEVKWGVRAGYINLINAYFKKGLNTLELIFPKYAPKVDNNNPQAYIQFVEKFTGIDRRTVITKAAQIYNLGRAIERVEGGRSWVDAEEWDEGWKLAIPQVKAYTTFARVSGEINKATAVAGSIPL